MTEPDSAPWISPSLVGIRAAEDAAAGLANVPEVSDGLLSS